MEILCSALRITCVKCQSLSIFFYHFRFFFFLKLLTTTTSYRMQEVNRALGDANLNSHTFHQLIYQCTQIVGLFLFPFTHLNHVCQVLTNILEQLCSHFHLSLKEPEQRILMVKTFKVSCRSKFLLENCYKKQPTNSGWTEQWHCNYKDWTWRCNLWCRMWLQELFNNQQSSLSFGKARK